MKIFRVFHLFFIILFFKSPVLGSSVLDTDSGHWEIISSPSQENFRSIMVYDTQVVWASGTHGTLIHTNDGGKTWEKIQVPGAETLDFRSVAVLDPNTIIAVSAGESEKGQTRIYRSADAGKHWQLVYSPQTPGIFLDAIKFWDKKRGLILGDPFKGKFLLLYTGDSGVHWDTLNRSHMPPAGVDEGAFAASNSSLFLGKKGRAWFGTGGSSGGRIFRSLNFGLDWMAFPTSIQKGKTAGIFSIYFLNENRGWASGGDYMKLKDTRNNNLISQNRGDTWLSPKGEIPSGYMESIIYLNSNQLLAIGPNGTSLYNETQGIWKIVDSLGFHALSKYQNSVWAIGAHGLLARWVP